MNVEEEPTPVDLRLRVEEIVRKEKENLISEITERTEESTKSSHFVSIFR